MLGFWINHSIIFQSVKPVRLLWVFITFCSVAIPSFRLHQELEQQTLVHQDLERQALDIAWHKGLESDNPKTQVFENFIKKAQKKLEAEVNNYLGREQIFNVTNITDCKDAKRNAPKLKIKKKCDK